MRVSDWSSDVCSSALADLPFDVLSLAVLLFPLPFLLGSFFASSLYRNGPSLKRIDHGWDQVLEPLARTVGISAAGAAGIVLAVELQDEVAIGHIVILRNGGCPPWPIADPAVGQRAFAIVLGFLLEFSRRDDVRHAVQLLLDHQADRLSIRNDGVALLRAVQSPALFLDGRDQLVETGTGAHPPRRLHKTAELAL